MFVDNWNPPCEIHVPFNAGRGGAHLARRSFPPGNGCQLFLVDKTSESTSVLDGGQQVQVLKRAIEAADGSDKTLLIVLIVQKVFDSLMGLGTALGFHSASFSLFNLVKKNRWIIKTTASFSKRDLARRAEFTLKFAPLKEILKAFNTNLLCWRLAVKCHDYS